MSSAIRRLQKDLLEYQANSEEFTLISAQPLEDNLFEWHVNICAPSGPYANLPLHFILDFPKNYPSSPPKVKLCTRIEHPNVFENWGDDGAWICLDLLKEYTTETKYEGWSSCYTVMSILLQLQSFLFSENVPQDYGGAEGLSYGNHSVVSSLPRIKKFKCKCGHHWKKPSPPLPEAFCKLVGAKVSHTGSTILAQKGAVINQNTVFWQEFPAWKTAAWDCGSLLKTRGHKLQYEVKIDWGWNGFYQEDIRIGWGVITSRNPLKYEVIAESPADVGVHYWPTGLKVGDVLTTAIDLKQKMVWYAVNGKLLKRGSSHQIDNKFTRVLAANENLVPVFRFRASRLKFNFGIPTLPVKQFVASRFVILERPQAQQAPAADIEVWKQSKDACADVFPTGVFQDIVDFLPFGDLINARSSCPTVRNLIEEAAIIPRREVHCFKTKQSWKECVLGIGLTCEKSEKLSLNEVKPNMEFLALEEWEKGHRQSAWGEKLTDFLVLPISRKHFDLELVCKYMQKFGAAYKLGGGRSAAEILNVFSKLMNMCVVTMMKESEGGKCNEKLLTGYTQFHHLLLALNESYPEIATLAQTRVNLFIKQESHRHKSKTPDLGKLLVMASLCPGLDWDEFRRVLFIECSTRRVLWYLKDCGALASTDHENDVYCQKVFELTETSRGVVAFQLAFLETLALPKEGESLDDVLANYFLRYGQPRSMDIETLFKRAKAIVNCTTWKEHLAQTGVKAGGTDLARILKASVNRSLKAGYHRKAGHHGRGKLNAARGNPSGRGLFSGTASKAQDLENRASFYLPGKFYPQVQQIASKIQGSIVTLPSNFREPVFIGAYEQATLQQLKKALRSELPYLSVHPLKTEFIEFQGETYLEHKAEIDALALKCNVIARMPPQFCFPVANICGSQLGIADYMAALSELVNKNIIIKTQDRRSFTCPDCKMSFIGREGALRPKTDPSEKDSFCCRFCWSGIQKTLRAAFNRKKREAAAKRDAEKNAEAEKKREERRAKILEEIQNGMSLPATFRLCRHAQVRKGKSKESEKVKVLLYFTWVNVVEVDGNRARISSPVEGWVSLKTDKGILLDVVNTTMVGEMCKAFPSLGCTEAEASEIAKKVDFIPKLEEAEKTPQKKTLQLPKSSSKHARKNSTDSESLHDASSDSGSTQSAPSRKFVKIGPKTAPTQTKKKTFTGRAIIAGRSYTACRAAVVRLGIKRDSKLRTTLPEGSVVYVEKVYPKAHRAKISTPVRGYISTWTKKGRLLQ